MQRQLVQQQLTAARIHWVWLWRFYLCYFWSLALPLSVSKRRCRWQLAVPDRPVHQPGLRVLFLLRRGHAPNVLESRPYAQRCTRLLGSLASQIDLRCCCLIHCVCVVVRAFCRCFLPLTARCTVPSRAWPRWSCGCSPFSFGMCSA